MRWNLTRQPNELEQLITKVESEMLTVGVNTDDFQQLMEKLTKLRILKGQESRKPVSTDTIAIVVGGIISTLIIVVYEHGHVTTSSAFGKIQQAKTPRIE